MADESRFKSMGLWGNGRGVWISLPMNIKDLKELTHNKSDWESNPTFRVVVKQNMWHRQGDNKPLYQMWFCTSKEGYRVYKLPVWDKEDTDAYCERNEIYHGEDDEGGEEMKFIEILDGESKENYKITCVNMDEISHFKAKGDGTVIYFRMPDTYSCDEGCIITSKDRIFSPEPYESICKRIIENEFFAPDYKTESVLDKIGLKKSTNKTERRW